MKITKTKLFKSKIQNLLILLLTCSVYLGCSSDDDSNTFNSTLSEDIANQEFVEIIEDHISSFPKNTQIAIAVIDNASTEYIGATNDNNIWRATDNANSIFEIGSITKVFTSICLSHLIMTNEATLDETLNNQFDFNFMSGANINLQQLANHTSGLPRLPTNVDEVIGFDQNDPYAHYNIGNLESYFENHVSLNATSGTQYEYSNLGMGILGYILAQKNGTSFEDLVNDLIFEHLQMNNTTTLLANVDSSRLVDGLHANGNIVSNWNFLDLSSGAGSIKSTVADLEKFVRKNFEDDLIYNIPQETTFSISDDLQVGLGWHIIESEGYRILWHDGGTAGYTSKLMMDKSNKKAVIVLSNVSATTNPNSEDIDDLCSSLLEHISLN